MHEYGALETAYESRLPFDDEGDETVQEDESVVLTEEVGWDGVHRKTPRDRKACSEYGIRST